MLDIASYAKAEGIPYRYWLADSWWYYKDPDGPNGGGVTNWTARPDVFPHGLEYVYEQTGWAVQGHNRFWSNKTTYAKENGGDYAFLLDAGGYALPAEQRFWDDLLLSSRVKWGLAVYEQDWLDQEFDNFPPLTTNATLARTWLAQMATGAARAGLTVQYCMSHCRHVLASAEFPSVTQARASGDYHPGGDQWHPVGTTSLFAYALGLAPSKDNYWSTTDQPGAKHYKDHPREPRSRLQAAVITLTKGPVAPSDAVGHSDVALIMRSAAADGTLLQPGAPAARLDSALLAAAIDAPPAGLPKGELWTAPTVLDGRTFIVVFAARMTEGYALTATELRDAAGARSLPSMVAVEANATATPVTVSDAAPLRVAACDELDFELYNLAPREANGWALLGEVAAKWVGVSLARFSALAADGTALSVTVRGSVGEVVDVAFAPPPTEEEAAAKTVTVRCVLTESGAARVTVDGATRECVAL